jgi:hypothetical protein
MGTRVRRPVRGLARNVYVREDQLLCGLCDRLPDAREGTDMSQYLRSHRLVIVCRASSWALEEVDESDTGTQLTLMLGYDRDPSGLMG